MNINEESGGKMNYKVRLFHIFKELTNVFVNVNYLKNVRQN